MRTHTHHRLKMEVSHTKQPWNALSMHYNSCSKRIRATKNRLLGHVLFWPHTTIIVNVVLQEIFALTRVKHIIGSKRVTVGKMVDIGNIQMQMIWDLPVLYGKWNSHANFINTSHRMTNNPFLNYWHFVSTNQRTLHIWVLPPR